MEGNLDFLLLPLFVAYRIQSSNYESPWFTIDDRTSNIAVAFKIAYERRYFRIKLQTILPLSIYM